MQAHGAKPLLRCTVRHHQCLRGLLQLQCTWQNLNDNSPEAFEELLADLIILIFVLRIMGLHEV
jgi:hypothetical protein